MASTEVDRHTGIGVEEVPSAAWGWSFVSPKVQAIGGLLTVVFLLMMLRGNHVGHVEDVWLIGTAVVILGILARDWWMRRRGWRR